MIYYCWFLTEAVKNINSGQMALLAVKGINLFPSSNEKLKGTIDVWWIVHILLNTLYYLFWVLCHNSNIPAM